MNRSLRLTFALAAVLAPLAGAAPARADRCDDLAAALKNQIDGVSVGPTAANVIYLKHPAAAQLRLGCAGRNFSNELFAASETRKPAPEFLALVADAAAIVFTIPRADTLRGATRCMNRLGLLRGNDVGGRFRRLDMRCTRSKTNATIAISREKDA